MDRTDRLQVIGLIVYTWWRGERRSIVRITEWAKSKWKTPSVRVGRIATGKPMKALPTLELAAGKADLGVGLDLADLEIGCVFQGRKLLGESARARPIA